MNAKKTETRFDAMKSETRINAPQKETRIYAPRYLYVSEVFEENYALVAAKGIIEKVGPLENMIKSYPHAPVEYLRDEVIVPGTVNVHNHSFQRLLRGLCCDRPFLEWRDKALYRYSPRLTREHIYGGALFAFGEMMKCGVTTVCDFFYLHNFGLESDERIIQAARDIGIRLVLARTLYDWPGAPVGYRETVEQAVSNTRQLALSLKGDPQVSVVPAPHSLHAATPEMIQAGHSLARELGTRFHIHVAEEPFEVEECKAAHGGLTTVEALDKLGVVDKSMVMVHGVYLKPSEIELFGARKGSLAYCPSSNMFLADGITDIVAMERAGVTIGLGSDGACSNNRNSVFEEMRMAPLLQKARTCDAMCVNYRQAFRMGTENGGRILDLPVGRLEEGMKADFTAISVNDFSMQPISSSKEQLLPNIVYSMQPTAIKKVVVGGITTVENGRLQTVAEEEILERIGRIMKEIE